MMKTQGHNYPSVDASSVANQNDASTEKNYGSIKTEDVENGGTGIKNAGKKSTWNASLIIMGLIVLMFVVACIVRIVSNYKSAAQPSPDVNNGNFYILAPRH